MEQKVIFISGHWPIIWVKQIFASICNLIEFISF